MKILLTSIGTRGDIEPFIAIGALLYNDGHDVIFSFPEQLIHLVPEKFKVYSLSPKVIELIEGEEGRIIMGAKASLFRKAKALFYLYREGQKTNKILVRQQEEIVRKENPDRVVHNVKCSYPTLWGIKAKKPTILLSPVPYFMYPVKGQAHVGFNGDHGTLINKLSYSLSNYGLLKTIYDAQKDLNWNKKKLISKKKIKEVLFSKKLFYPISSTLFQRPKDWPSHVQVLGYHNRENSGDWTPNNTLLNFLKVHPKCLFVTFGSMVNNDPAEKTNIILNCLDDLKIPAIINLASGGLVVPDKFKRNPNFYFIDQIPYSWILPQVYGIIHHGGSGTTHSAIKYGCASLILPHVIDQFSWNILLHQKGVGPKGISINKITEKKLKPLIMSLYNNEEYKEKSTILSRSMNNEKNEKGLIEFLTS